MATGGALVPLPNQWTRGSGWSAKGRPERRAGKRGRGLLPVMGRNLASWRPVRRLLAPWRSLELQRRIRKEAIINARLASSERALQGASVARIQTLGRRTKWLKRLGGRALGKQIRVAAPLALLAGGYGAVRGGKKYRREDPKKLRHRLKTLGGSWLGAGLGAAMQSGSRLPLKYRVGIPLGVGLAFSPVAWWLGGKGYDNRKRLGLSV